MKLLFLFICIYNAEALYINFSSNNLTLLLDETMEMNYIFSNFESGISLSSKFIIYSDNENVVTLSEQVILNPSLNSSGSFSIHGKFIGRSSILCKDNETNQNVEGRIDVRVIREQSIADTIFVATVATLVCIIYVNFGCALDWTEPKKIIKKPIGPAIGFVGQFILMPLLSYGLGLVIFPNNPDMRLGMFFVGCSPAGGASNVWTALLEGNINLSVIMTAISTFAAFGMMPLWIFTLGKIIFKDANVKVPYSQITTYILSLVIPLALGYLIQRYFKKVAAFMAKIMKGLASLLIIVIIVFATATNVYLFKIFSWEIVISGLAVPWLAYVIGFLVAVALKQPIADCIAIAVEIGIQNTGISIFLLRIALPQPEADLTTVVPVANAILTPVPLGIALVCILIRKRFNSRSKVDVTNMKSVELS